MSEAQLTDGLFEYAGIRLEATPRKSASASVRATRGSHPRRAASTAASSTPVVPATPGRGGMPPPGGPPAGGIGSTAGGGITTPQLSVWGKVWRGALVGFAIGLAIRWLIGKPGKQSAGAIIRRAAISGATFYVVRKGMRRVMG